MSQQTQERKSKQCTRCGHTIYWNNNSRFFEDDQFPKFQHCCPLPCNKEGCGGTIYFSNIAPKNQETGRAIPLDLPIPQIDPKNSAQMIWIVHVHKNNIPAEQAPPATIPPIAPELKAIQNPAPGQQTLQYTPTAEETKAVVQKVQESTIPAGMTGSTGNPQVDTSLVGAINSNTQAVKDINERLAKIEEFFNKVLVPEYTDFTNYWKIVRPKLEVIIGKVAEGSITSASDLVEHNLSQ